LLIRESGFARRRIRQAARCRMQGLEGGSPTTRNDTSSTRPLLFDLFQTRAVREIKPGKRLGAAEGRCLLASKALDAYIWLASEAHLPQARIGLAARVNACARRAGMVDASVGLAEL
jgi:hypothetical protein